MLRVCHRCGIGQLERHSKDTGGWASDTSHVVAGGSCRRLAGWQHLGNAHNLFLFLSHSAPASLLQWTLEGALKLGIRHNDTGKNRGLCAFAARRVAPEASLVQSRGCLAVGCDSIQARLGGAQALLCSELSMG